MMAAPDAEKVRLLVARGADVKSRGAAGTDALTIAAAHYGTSTSLRALLDAGAEAQSSERRRHSPLQYAAMSGDIESVRLLLARGAEASAEAVSESVTFGHPDVVQALVDAGADVTLTERSGINLLHWATITNRATVIPVLVKAGVPLDAIDDFGYTPLMYAATRGRRRYRDAESITRRWRRSQHSQRQGPHCVRAGASIQTHDDCGCAEMSAWSAYRAIRRAASRLATLTGCRP